MMEKLSFKPIETGDAKLTFDNLEANLTYFAGGFTKKEFDSWSFKDHVKDSKELIENVKQGKVVAFIILNKNKEFIGRCSIHSINKRDKRANISLTIKEKFWGKEYGTEAVTFLTKLAFSKLKLHRLEYGVYSHNERSMKLAEKLGFKYEGTLRDAKKIGNKYYDRLIYSKLKSEYKK